MSATPARPQIAPPMKGVFPLDHFKECKGPELDYLNCIKQNSGKSFKCQNFIKSYLKCRMDNSLLTVEEMEDLGLLSYNADDDKKRKEEIKQNLQNVRERNKTKKSDWTW